MRLSDLTKIEKVSVFKDGLPAGTLTRTSHGAEFIYDEEFRARELHDKSYGVAFSLSPLNEKYKITGTNLHSFFAGLLPEGMRLKALRSTLKTSEDDLFSMLLALGTNCIGDVYVKDPSAQEAEYDYEAPKLNEVSFWDLFRESIASSDLHLRETDSGIPGVIPKLSASMISFPLRLHGPQAQYLLKLAPPEHTRIIENEHFFMRMAKECGLNVASTKIVSDKEGVQGLLVQRFDREYDERRGHLARLHQEDACQFLDRYPQDKYRLTMREIGEGIERFTSSPLIELRKLIELYLFSYLIGNGDLHGKNISLLHSRGRIELSPAYDLLSTLPYGDRQMALRLGAKNDNFTARDFVEFGKIFHLPEKAVQGLITKLITVCKASMSRMDEIGFSDKILRDIQRTFEKRAEKLSSSR